MNFGDLLFLENGRSPSTIDIQVGIRIKEYRKQLDLTLQDVASQIGISYQQLHKYEYGESRIHVELLCKLALIYGCKIENFLEYTPAKSTNKYLMPAHTNESKKLNVMLVENDPQEEFRFRKALENSEFFINFICAHSEAQMMDILKYKTSFIGFPMPHLILMCESFNNDKGNSIINRLKDDNALRRIPIIKSLYTNTLNRWKSFPEKISGYVISSPEEQLFADELNIVFSYWWRYYHVVESSQSSNNIG